MSNRKLKYMLVGGGSGGHLTPLVAVAEAIKDIDDNCEVIFVGQRGEDLKAVVERDSIDKHASISAGKFRRYHGESLLSHLMDLKTIALNVRDFFRFIVGVFEAWLLLGRMKPDAIFLKGGFVSVPIGIAARLRAVPYITHDSDAIPGLANRLTAKHARYNTTAMPVELYPYDEDKTLHVGIPLKADFKLVDKVAQDSFKTELGYRKTDEILFSVGGGLGARLVNKAVAEVAKKLLPKRPHLKIIQITGKKLYKETQKMYGELVPHDLMDRVQLIDFTNELYKYSGAADIVVSRAGATNIAELAAQAKPCIFIPNPVLTGGQQLHNARVISQANAAIVVDESEVETLASKVEELLSESPESRASIGVALHSLSHAGAADSIADLLKQVAVKSSEL